MLRGECEPVECEQGEENLTSLLKEEMVAKRGDGGEATISSLFVVNRRLLSLWLWFE